MPQSTKTKVYFGVAAFVLALALWAFLQWRFHPEVDAMLSWLLSISLVTFLAYGFDKLTAILKWTRVPEIVLLSLTIAGGTVGALAGMLLFRHKTSKQSFLLKFVLIAAVQVILIVVYYTMIRR